MKGLAEFSTLYKVESTMIDNVFFSSRLETWRQEMEHQFQPLIAIGPDASLYQAVTRLLQKKIHRLPVLDPATGDVIYIVTHKRLFRFLCLHVSIEYSFLRVPAIYIQFVRQREEWCGL